MNKQHQCGMSMWGYLLVVMVIITAVTMTLRLGQHYVDFAMVKLRSTGSLWSKPTRCQKVKSAIISPGNFAWRVFPCL